MNSQSPLRLKAEIYDHNSIAFDSGRENRSLPVDLPKQGYTEFFSWGNDNFGQLGHGTNEKQNQKQRRLNLPKSLSFDVIITDIGCGTNHASFLTASG